MSEPGPERGFWPLLIITVGLVLIVGGIILVVVLMEQVK